MRVAVGLAVALPLGAIGLLVVRTGTERGVATGLAAAAGVATADIAYAAVAATAGGVLAGPVATAAGPLRVVAALVLLAVAAAGLARALRRPAGAAPTSAPEAARPWRTWAGFLGLTALNPLTLLTFGAVVVALPAGLLDGPAQRAAFVAGAGGASLAWQAVLAVAGAALGRRLDARWQRWTALAGNAAIAALAVTALLT